MSCTRTREMLDDHVDGALAPDDARAVEAHLAGCAACRAEAEALADLVRGLAELPAEIEPPAAIRRAIDLRLDAAPAGRRTAVAPWLAAAAVLALAAALWLAVERPGRAPGGRGDDRAAPGTADSNAAVAAVAAAADDHAVAGAERALLRARDDLRAALAARRDALPPETLRLVEDNLQVIEAAIGRIEVALAAEPGNPDLERMRVAYRRQELALLERANRAASRM